MAEPARLPKGILAEEQLRVYFLSLGYYVSRGVKIRVDGSDITDIDLWLYHKHSPLGRERINVDVKNKKTPQAIERIFWARGVQMTMGLDKCIVATTDRRQAVVDFGTRHKVSVIDGHFLSKLPPVAEGERHLTEEEFRQGFGIDGRSRKTSEALQRLEVAKSRLVGMLNFDGCNAWLADIRHFMEARISGLLDEESSLRAVYLLISQLLVGLDFALSPVAFMPQAAKRDMLDEGLRHGAEGRVRTESVLRVASVLVQQYLPEGRALSDKMRRDVLRLAEDAPVAILAEYFSGTRASSDLFRLAKSFSQTAYMCNVLAPVDLSADLKSVLAILSDFFGLNRQQVFGAAGDPQLAL